MLERLQDLVPLELEGLPELAVGLHLHHFAHVRLVVFLIVLSAHQPARGAGGRGDGARQEKLQPGERLARLVRQLRGRAILVAIFEQALHPLRGEPHTSRRS